MNSDIRATDLGAPTASWEIMALRREMTHVTPMKSQPGAKPIYNALKWHKWIYSISFTACIADFSNYLLIQAFQVIHHYGYLFSTNKCAVCPTTVTIRVTRSKPGQHIAWQTVGNHGLPFFHADGPNSITIQTANNRMIGEGDTDGRSASSTRRNDSATILRYQNTVSLGSGCFGCASAISYIHLSLPC